MLTYEIYDHQFLLTDDFDMHQLVDTTDILNNLDLIDYDDDYLSEYFLQLAIKPKDKLEVNWLKEGF